MHHQLFMQHTMNMLQNVNNHKIKLWNLISGANTYSNKTNEFKFSYIPIKILESKYTFYNHLISHLHRYIHIVLNIHKTNNINIKYYSNKCEHDKTMRQNVYHHYRCDTYQEWIEMHHMIHNDDLIIATDSSNKDNLTGIGIYIKDNDNIHKYSQGIGSVDNHYGELYAIRKSMKIIEDRLINTNNRRTFIMTDSLNNFLPLIITPKNPKRTIIHHDLWKDTQNQIATLNAILIKIKSHTKPIQQYFNEQADILADEGRTNPNNNEQIIPSINTNYASNHNHHIKNTTYSQIVQQHMNSHPNPFNITGLERAHGSVRAHIPTRGGKHSLSSRTVGFVSSAGVAGFSDNSKPD